MTTDHLFVDYLDTPCGLLKIYAHDMAINAITFIDRQEEETKANALTAQATLQLTEYFANTRRTFDLPLAPKGTVFQQQVWQLLCDIPYGETVSYSTIARRLGNPKAGRAVGSANGKNPISIIVPCHRVIGANGTLTGYAAGLARKSQLLRLENPQLSLTP
ncbi:MAG: methylated-DNA-[protein]-cysteine S-methyltransferase [Paraglaciecola sp.]|jgi:methylated-DNA-[protein]-cysteine S-methyltransferase